MDKQLVLEYINMDKFYLLNDNFKYFIAFDCLTEEDEKLLVLTYFGNNRAMRRMFPEIFFKQESDLNSYFHSRKVPKTLHSHPSCPGCASKPESIDTSFLLFAVCQPLAWRDMFGKMS